jgi:HPt (histidine-containing phosphotransfer) domain-containing protein
MTDPLIIDQAALDRLDKLGGPGFAVRIIGIFLGEGPRRIADARDALDRRDGPALAHAVHALISSAGNVGATGLTTLVRDMEEDAEHARWDVLPERMARLLVTFEAVRARLEQLRADAMGASDT